MQRAAGLGDAVDGPALGGHDIVQVASIQNAHLSTAATGLSLSRHRPGRNRRQPAISTKASDGKAPC